MLPIGTDTQPCLSVILFSQIMLVYFSVVITMVNLQIDYSTQTNRVYKPLKWFVIELFGRIIRKERLLAYKEFDFIRDKWKKAERVEKAILRRMKWSDKDAFLNEKLTPNDSKARKAWLRATSTIIWKNRQKMLKNAISSVNQKSKVTKFSSDGKEHYECTLAEKLADQEWKLFVVLLDRLCFYVYMLALISLCICVWLFASAEESQIAYFDELVETKLSKK